MLFNTPSRVRPDSENIARRKFQLAFLEPVGMDVRHGREDGWPVDGR